MKIEKRIEKARKQVKEARGRHAEIARYLKVSYNWVRTFSDGRLKEPGAIKFEHLEEWLEKHL